uniref:Post-GPI attachment to proteins factor 3 n=1 Tax=Blastobotrys adeninivorans TaxID=409370 RepID=A0A060T776_BLAAD
MIRLLLVLGICSVALASAGDRLHEFRNCVQSCVDISCSSGMDAQVSLPLHLRLLFWTCDQNCDYTCQRVITHDRIQNGQPILQFHGKWPFLRMWGVQEPAAVVFSLANFVPHLLGFLMLRGDKLLHRHKHHYRDEKKPAIYKFYLGFAIVSMNAWIWSTVFHTRDFIVTERLDYFSAGLMILYGLYTVVIRVFRLDQASKRAILVLWSIVCAGVFIAHVGYLSLIRFSYSYNMMFGVCTGLLQNILWTYHSFSRYFSYPAHRRGQKLWTLSPFFIVLSIMAGMAFELLDFAPILDVFDAHSLWHAATIMPAFWWYNWMQRDLSHLHKREVKVD